jgi:RimJ/RimL family protein N-acetyltransferase
MIYASNLPALALYEKMGFRRFGQEPDALLVDGQLYDDILLVLFLHPQASEQQQSAPSSDADRRA